MSIGTRIKQQKPFASVEHEVFVALQRLVADLTQDATELLKTAGLSGPQYNVLRIVRGAGAEGLTCSGIAERLIARDPDMTRLLDRLEKLGFISRSRDGADRRVVTTRLTEDGVAILAELDEPMHALHHRQLGHLGKAKLGQLLDLIESASRA